MKLSKIDVESPFLNDMCLENKTAACLTEKITNHFEHTLKKLPGRHSFSFPQEPKLLKKAKNGAIFPFSLKQELTDFIAIHFQEGLNILKNLEKALKEGEIILTEEEKTVMQQIFDDVKDSSTTFGLLQLDSIYFEENIPYARCTVEKKEGSEKLEICLGNLSMLLQGDVASFEQEGLSYRLFTTDTSNKGVKRRYEENLRHLILSKIDLLSPKNTTIQDSSTLKKVDSLCRCLLLSNARESCYATKKHPENKFNTIKLTTAFIPKLTAKKSWLEDTLTLVQKKRGTPRKIQSKSLKILEKSNYLKNSKEPFIAIALSLITLFGMSTLAKTVFESGSKLSNKMLSFICNKCLQYTKHAHTGILIAALATSTFVLLLLLVRNTLPSITRLCEKKLHRIPNVVASKT